MTPPNKRWRELAESIVYAMEANHELDGVYTHFGDRYGWNRTRIVKRLASEFSEAIETAVNEERARARIVGPSDVTPKILEMIGPIQGKDLTRIQAGINLQEFYRWLKEQAKIEWGDE